MHNSLTPLDAYVLNAEQVGDEKERTFAKLHYSQHIRHSCTPNFERLAWGSKY
jgi:hypothetical protein